MLRMKFNEIDGIIFDKDGTLMEFQSFWLPVTYRVISKLCNEYELNVVIKKECINALGIDENDCIDSEGQLAIGTYATISTSLRNVLLRHEKSVQNSQLQKKITQWFEEESEKQTCHFTTDLKQLCDCLQKKNIHIAVATTDNLEVTQRCLKQGEMNVEVISASDSSIPKKPDTSLIQYLAEIWNTTCEKIVMIGDTPNDLRFAKKAGAKTIGVLSGVSNEQLLLPYADCILNNIGELRNIL